MGEAQRVLRCCDAALVQGPPAPDEGQAAPHSTDQWPTIARLCVLLQL
jgi:hypothetical protein